MNSDIIVNIKDMKDIGKITKDTKYINLAIDNVDSDVIDYFLLNGKNYSYSDMINDRNGFIYADFEMFKYGESIIDNIMDSMPLNLSKLEIVRYIYVSLGRRLCVDINTMDDKNEIISFSKISTVNNIWGALSKEKVNDSVISKIFMYICSRIGIKCELISSSIKGSVANKVYLDDSFLVVDLFNDIYNIQGGFTTKYFDKFNDNKSLDKRVGYIKDEYMNYYVDMVFKNFDYTSEKMLYDILDMTSKVININSVGPYELSKIYRDIFDKYASNYDIKINNLFVCEPLEVKEHFVLFSFSDEHYSFNYNRGCFVRVDEDMLGDNIRNNRIGVYDNEDFEVGKKMMAL